MSSDSVNPDLAKERDAASFRTELLTNIIDGGPEKTKRRRYVEHLVLSDPDFIGPDYNFLSREEQLLHSTKEHVQLTQKVKQWGLTDMDISHAVGATLSNGRSVLAMHYGAFMPPIRLMGSEKQKATWLPKAESLDIVGCYAQTELGHGSFVRGIETRADYDKNTKEFVMSSPTITATKWWAGSLGLAATHALVMAQLHTNGRNHGLHPFIVPIRDMDTRESLAGVEVGDQGPKFGFVAIDNGYLRLNNVRIPRDNLLQKSGEVLDDGTYVKPKSSKLVYGGMLGIRAGLPKRGTVGLAKAITIAIRYSCVRRQSELKPGEPEPQVLDYQTQQHKLIPLLAGVYAYWFVSEWMLNLHASVIQEIHQENFSRLPEDHVSAAGLKALVTWKCHEGVEACRLACGGHGYSLSSGLPEIYKGTVANSTAEGETTVLLLQTAKYLIKCYMDIQQGKQLDPSLQYLTKKTFKPVDISNDVDVRSLLEAFQFKSKRTLEYVGDKVSKALQKSGNQNDALQGNLVLLSQLAKAHVEVVILQAFVNKLEQLSRHYPNESKVLRCLCQIYGINEILRDTTTYMKHQYLSGSQLEQLEDLLLSLYPKIRPEAVALVDAFDFDDRVLGSVLGRYDGQVYDNLFKWAKDSPLNTREVRQSINELLQALRPSKL